MNLFEVNEACNVFSLLIRASTDREKDKKDKPSV